MWNMKVIKTWIKQLACAHDWTCRAVHYHDGEVTRQYYCPKCGKLTKMVYGPYREGKL